MQLIWFFRILNCVSETLKPLSVAGERDDAAGLFCAETGI